MQGRVLRLAADYTPNKVYSVEDAIGDIVSGRVEIVEGTGEFCHSPSTTVEIPSVVRLYQMNSRSKRSNKKSIPVTPRNVCARDRHICAYQRPKICKGRATTIDHVQPSSKGGPNEWENVVAACTACNHRKGDRTLKELGWELLTKPWRPQGAVGRVLMHAHNPSWDKWFTGQR